MSIDFDKLRSVEEGKTFFINIPITIKAGDTITITNIGNGKANVGIIRKDPLPVKDEEVNTDTLLPILDEVVYDNIPDETIYIPNYRDESSLSYIVTNNIMHDIQDVHRRVTLGIYYTGSPLKVIDRRDRNHVLLDSAGFIMFAWYRYGFTRRIMDTEFSVPNGTNYFVRFTINTFPSGYPEEFIAEIFGMTNSGTVRAHSFEELVSNTIKIVRYGGNTFA